MKRMPISICGVVLYNGLIENMKLAMHLDQFKKMYEKYIFFKAYKRR